MFYCGITKKLSKPNEKPIRLVTERREREYWDEDGKAIIGRGWEIVAELNVTLQGLKIWCDNHPEDAESAETYVRMFKAEEARKKVALREGSQKSAA